MFQKLHFIIRFILMAQEKLLKRILQLLANIIDYELNDPRVKFASVTKIELSKDKRYCTAYISVLGKPEEQKKIMKGLESARGFIQTKLGKRLELRHIPILKFVQDRSIEKSIMMEKLFREFHNNTEENENQATPEQQNNNENQTTTEEKND